MSRDIRSFFQPKKPQKPKIEEDDDVIPESPDVHIKDKKKISRKKQVLRDDSDEEIFTLKKNNLSNESNKSHSRKAKPPQKPVLKEVKAVDLFGSEPIKRSEPLVKKEKRKTEFGIHSDEEFDKSLLELDIEESSPQEKSPIKSINESKSDHVKDKFSFNANEVSPIKDKQLSKSKDNGTFTKEKSSRAIYNNVKNENKRKFAEFVDSEHNHQENNGDIKNKKKKLNTSNLEVKTNYTETTKTIYTSEYFDDSCMEVEEDQKDTKHKKKKHDKSLNESALTDEERHERRRQSAALYQQYLHRAGPKHLGSKEIPEGPPNCLKDYAFLLTGVLDSFERDEIVAAINKYGGCIKSGVSKKVTHVLAGSDAGPAKMAKAQELGIKIINEDQFLDMIAHPPHKDTTEAKVDIKKEKTPIKKAKTPQKKTNGFKKLDKESRLEEKVTRNSSDDDTKESSNKINGQVTKVKELNKENGEQNSESTSNESIISMKSVSDPSTVSLMWVDKYKPQSVKSIIGQRGEASNVNKLMNWLTKWYVNRKAKLPKPSPWAKNDDGGYYKAALLSGPPGVGKTTTVALVCKELGFDMVEFNASDTRNKTLIKEQIGELLTTTSLSGYAKGNTGKQAVTKKHVLVMDEVDGMAGNEDRGGLQELISLIKATSVPIICMCNDRNSQKMRNFVNYCYDLRFNRPRVDQIKSAMMTICFKENIKIPQEALTQLIVASNQDVRQTLNLLSMWAVDSDLTDMERLKKDAKTIKKDIKLGPWEAIRKVFTAKEHKTMSIHDKSDLFFYDYSLAPLFVQENYLQVAPDCPVNQVLDRLSQAADSISRGDLVDARIRRAQAWSLLPMQAMYSSVIPGHAMAGHVNGQIQFPGWLGKNSRATKMQRLCQEIHAHTRLSTSGSKSSIFLDYCTHLRDAVVMPLIKEKSEGIEKSLEVLESYHLLREDLDSLTELSLWPGQKDPMALIDSKVKAAMTRTYNKNAAALPYAPGSIKHRRGRETEDGDEDDGLPEDEAEDSDPENDALIKKKKKESEKGNKEKAGSSKEKSNAAKEKPSTSKRKKK
ncbi:replication factor C subunit 1 [Galleria mellonella]|uniref:Replication factor C subunit 1 n=1 Tax=Galleria mellonella TaxID=7137 RepID=A0ABM3MR85_GALME|nr:replication factor C subunit 1 [Galleria mellonella]